MANEEQLKILEQGVEVWNQWRKKHLDEKINLRGENLEGANLSRANLSRVDLQRAELIGANLSGADLCDAVLQGAKLDRANLNGANLERADLRGADLIQITLCEANITGGYLYGTARDDWIIDDIKCDYVYWDAASKKRTPPDRNFRPGEFEERYKQLPTFEYAFEHGITLIDIAMINQIVNNIKDLHPDWELKIDSFHSRGQPHANFTIREKDLIAQAFSQIKTKYEATLNRLKGQYEESNRILSEIVKELTNKPQLMITGDIIMGDKRIGRDNIEISGQAQVNQLTTGDSGNDPSDSTE
jgi:uncharacterized protein YjbI with pentapeptide repeats